MNLFFEINSRKNKQKLGDSNRFSEINEVITFFLCWKQMTNDK